MALRFFPRSTTDNLTPPRKPPATSTTTGDAHTVDEWANNQADVPYGAVHRELKMYPDGTRRSDFK